MSSSCQSIATAASSAATTAAAVSMSVSNATSVGSLIAAACLQPQQHLPHQHQAPPAASHYVNGTGSLGRLKFHHKSLDASDEELEYAQVCGQHTLIENGRGEAKYHPPTRRLLIES